VVGVCSGRNEEMVKGLGADEVSSSWSQSCGFVDEEGKGLLTGW